MKIALITTLAILAILFSPAAQAANTYPPENAALLYYKALDWYPPDDNIMDKISDYSKGDIELDEDIVEHLDSYQHVIRELTVASDIPHCNWGIDFSEGMNALIPGLNAFKRYAYLLLADARRLALNGDYNEAIDRCITAEKFASHVSGNTLINSLVGTAISAMSDKCIAHVISETLLETDKLLHLQSQLDHFSNRIERMKAGFFAEKQLAEVMYDKNSPHRLTYEMLTQSLFHESTGVEAIVNPKTKDPVRKELIEKVKAEDSEFFDKALKYHIGIIYDAVAAFDRPYNQACEILSKQIPEKLENDAKEKPEALMANTLIPACLKVYTLAVRSQNSLNALKTALDIYLIQAKTGKLPKTLPASAINDLYTDKAMVYEITDDGFTLRCQGEDTEKGKKNDTYKFRIKN